MYILIVDDSPVVCDIIENCLNEAGYTNLLFAESAQSVLNILGMNQPQEQQTEVPEIDLILLDIILPDMDGRELCRLIKGMNRFKDVPIIMVTALSNIEDLEKAFNAGAMDYITKPINNIELLVRIRSALKLKFEMDRSKKREQHLLIVTRQLKEAVAKLNQLSSLDGLTGIPNRRYFDQIIQKEWNRCRRNIKPLSVIFIDIDFFKVYNDTYGHQSGDDCLKTVAGLLQKVTRRSGDTVFRYGGEEFIAVLPETAYKNALMLAEKMCRKVEAAGIAHAKSPVSDFVTVSLGVAATLPTGEVSYESLISAADKALYDAKKEGRNRVRGGNPEGKE